MNWRAEIEWWVWAHSPPHVYKLIPIPTYLTLISFIQNLPNMRSLKVLLLWFAFMFAALGVKVSLPIAATHLPLLWTFFLLCFKPPYLFLLLNTIIISIVASSKFHSSNPQPNSNPPPPSPVLQEQEAEKKVIHQGIEVKRTDSTEIPSPSEKPLVSARFIHRKFTKSTSEGIYFNLLIIIQFNND